MKLFIHINSMGLGGAERVVSILSAYLAERGHDIVIATQWQDKDEYTLHANVRRISVGLTEEDEKKRRLGRAWCRLFRLRECICQEKPDLVISFCCKANFRSAFSVLGTSIPLLVSVRNNPVEDYKPHKLATWIMEQRATGCVFQTPDAKQYFSKALQKKSKVIYNPISENYLEENQELVKERKKEIVTVGRITSQKNQMLLLEAYAELAEEYSDYVLKIYGEASEQQVYETLQEYVSRKNLQNRVLFMGVTDNVKQEIEHAAVFVLPSDYEGMPNALIEALAAGVPSIATDCPCGAVPLLMEHEVSGLVIPVGDKEALKQSIRRILSDEQWAEQLGIRARSVIEKVHPDKICQEWEQYIEKLVRK